jgi:iron complex transport system ATP-binding protein
VPGPDLLWIRGLVAGYGRAEVLRGVDLSVDRGEVVGLIGPNGAGKTTVIRVVSGALRADAGEVRVAGVELHRRTARETARLVSVVPQELAPTFEFTALEVVLMGRAPYQGRLGGGGAEDFRRVREAMEAAGVHHLAERSLGHLSGGEKQRVVLAQALAQDAPLLLLDEPTTHLDPGHVVAILEVVGGLAREGRAILAVFHDLNLAAASCHRLVALDGGEVRAEGSPEEVLTPSLLRGVYGVEADVYPHPLTGRPVVVMGPPLRPPPARGMVRAHVVGGAGRGGPVMRALAERGYDVTAGVLHGSDTDAEVAERLNLARVSVPPFSPVDDDAVEEAVGMMRSAALTVVCDAPYGPGNLGNLRAALRAAEEGSRVVVLEQVPPRERDFTGGEATRLWEELRRRAEVVRTYDQLFAVLPTAG